MENQSWIISEEEKERFISALTPELALLRTKAGISQEELASFIGTSRQTYGSIERKTRRMSWDTFLSLIMFFDYNQKTHQMIRTIGAFPHEIIKHFNEGADFNEVDLGSFLGEGMQSIVDSLDEQALRSIRTLIMVEYARCTNTPGEVVVKAFDGRNFNPSQLCHPTQTEILTTKALKSIKEKKRKYDK